MEFIVYSTRAVVLLLVSWLAIRLIGKKSVAEMTSYDLVAIMLLTTVAAEPLVYKITTKAITGVLVIMLATIVIGSLSLKKLLYNFDTDSAILIANGKINLHKLKKVRMNIPLLLSELRVKGYQNVSDIQLAILEPIGKLSVFPKPDYRPVQPSDLKIVTGKTGLGLPFILDGEILHSNLKYAELDLNWLINKIKDLKTSVEDVLLLEMNSNGQIYVQMKDNLITSTDIFPQKS